MSDLYAHTRAFVSDAFGEENLYQVERCVELIKQFRPDADEAFLLAGLMRSVERPLRNENYARARSTNHDFLDPKQVERHQQESARIAGEFLASHGADDVLIERVKELISKHEEGGTEDQNLLMNCDSMSFFETQIPKYLKTFVPLVGKEVVKKRFDWVFGRITDETIREAIRPQYTLALQKLESLNVKISVIVLTFNSEEYLPELLDSLEQTEWPEGEHEIVFVDNASKDRTREILDATGYHTIYNETNEGFAGGNNIGMKYALHNGADYVVLLNDDTVVTPDWIQVMYYAHQQHQDSGAVQPLLLYWKDKNMVNSWGNYIHYLGFGFAGGNLQDKGQVIDRPDIYRATYCTGAAVMYWGVALKKAGLFDRSLESYHEDLDICLKMRLYGYRAYVAPRTIVYHKYEFLKVSKSMQGNYKYYLMERNRIFILLKYYLPRTLLFIMPMWFVMEAATFGFSVIRGFWKEKLRAYWWVLTHWGYIMGERRGIRRLRRDHKITEREFTEDFVSEISFQEINNPLLTYVGNPLTRLYWSIVRKLL